MSSLSYEHVLKSNDYANDYMELMTMYKIEPFECDLWVLCQEFSYIQVFQMKFATPYNWPSYCRKNH